MEKMTHPLNKYIGKILELVPKKKHTDSENWHAIPYGVSEDDIFLKVFIFHGANWTTNVLLPFEASEMDGVNILDPEGKTGWLRHAVKQIFETSIT